MTKNPSTILRNILDIVNYPEDKSTFIDQFGETCMQKGFAAVSDSLSEDSKLKLRVALSLYLQTEEFEKIVFQYVSPETYNKAIQDATSSLFEDFLRSIEPTLTEIQSNSLDRYLSSL
ncbi:MAG TPA: hypothetical protein VLG12_00760 [Candidatus Saccharimonadales bacterium]|nr:hypothetical protein [Candidatus Saccharimonadales bacterium]